MPQVRFFLPEDIITPPPSPEIPAPPPTPSSDDETLYEYDSRFPTPAFGHAEHRGPWDTRMSPPQDKTCYMPIFMALAVSTGFIAWAGIMRPPVVAVLYLLLFVINMTYLFSWRSFYRYKIIQNFRSLGDLLITDLETLESRNRLLFQRRLADLHTKSSSVLAELVGHNKSSVLEWLWTYQSDVIKILSHERTLKMLTKEYTKIQDDMRATRIEERLTDLGYCIYTLQSSILQLERNLTAQMSDHDCRPPAYVEVPPHRPIPQYAEALRRAGAGRMI
ncbi:hypothetical protein SISSUDRAFT_1066286 [Sistotremastrum suecicum HHB10207 ss-3]|uniref:Uncharacterized protein n=1 Tax=Sistotremastrum suecicum HHB10207 ss-3 TaxID=1314776 RepID=A0A165YHJ2_9AGAM|nr:hypothetical protein SISSUDRAFT_1066286 [Sistotremastrum suecicum HHB10207 ss-3]